MEQSIADKIFEGDRIKTVLEDTLYYAGVLFEETSFDSYDRSIELFDVPADCRLSPEAQKIIFDAGFSTAYLNHDNKWETHYTFDKFDSGKFKEVDGWRVSYPRKRGLKEGRPILVEKLVETWPKEWFETGYVIVQENR
jgi:hypothetical protein